MQFQNTNVDTNQISQRIRQISADIQLPNMEHHHSSDEQNQQFLHQMSKIYGTQWIY